MMGLSAVFATGAANAAPQVALPAAPVTQITGDFAQAPGDLLYFGQVMSIQMAGSSIRFRSSVLESRATRLEAYAARYPDTFFGRAAAQAAERARAERARLGSITLSACRDGEGIAMGPYGTVTRGAC
ncbi:hypothetical protein C6A85_92235 [Mycobacterium sp. ITM-2017-0098]|nr:hypothetical protein C6A85_92235 [Mycobacterium sp. ITM-2017-0098]